MKPACLLAAFLVALALCPTTQAQQPDDPCQSCKQQTHDMELKLRDWPKLARFHDANIQLGPPAHGESRVVFFGDSITESWNLADSFPGKPYANRGISGQTTPQMLLRFRQDVIALHPKLVVILAGTNDIAENTGPTSVEAIADNLISMAELAKSNGIRLVLCSVLPAARYPWRPEIQPVEKIRALNDRIKKYAAQTHVAYIDYYSAMVDTQSGLKDELGKDAVHPNAAGYVVMTRLANKAIATQLRQHPN